ncbi:MAG: DNA mismatch repair endonuclease MutL [Bacteroides sp.]
MSDVIHLLPDSVANQIAAGEVIQRPASVIKELVENSIDAGANNIQIIINDAGKTCMQVIDDGKGMSEVDARMAFERHATSKIKQATDLFSLRTMGFRGEALASIAAVAQVELITKTEQEELGTHIRISGSKLEGQEAIAANRGAQFIVKNLFYNIPARRKFLKTDATELSRILSEFERIALVNEDRSFTLYSNDTELFNLPASLLRQRIIQLFGKKLNQELLSVEVDTTLIKISGFVAKPEASRKRGAHQFFFVNGRYMRHPYFFRAVMEAYKDLIPEGDQISFFLYLEVDPATIDVNIHPTKTEVKFENEQGIWQIIAAAVKETLGKFNEVPSIDFDTAGMPDIPVFDDTEPIAVPKVEVDTSFNPFKSSGGANNASYQRQEVDWEQLYAGIARDSKVNTPPPADFTMSDMVAGEIVESKASQDSPGLYDEEDSRPYEKGSSLLQFKGRYILTSVKSGLMLIDQHRAHVRVLYDKFIGQIKQKKGSAQGVLFPEIIDLPASQAAVLDSILEDFNAVGFELANLGGGSYSINGIPEGIEGLDPVELVHHMLETAMEKGGDVKEEVQSILALTLAKSAAIVYGQVLSSEEMGGLVDALFACVSPNYTPDGLAVLSTIFDEEINKRFDK